MAAGLCEMFLGCVNTVTANPLHGGSRDTENVVVIRISISDEMFLSCMLTFPKTHDIIY